MNIFQILFPHYKKKIKESKEGIRNAKTSRERSQYEMMHQEDQRRMNDLMARQGKSK